MVVREFINLIGFKVNESQLKRTESRINSAANKLGSIGTRMSLAVTTPFLLLSRSLAKVISDFEQLDVAFTTIIGDADRANKLLTELLAVFVTVCS